ncbi:MAG: family 20 glycosylhydrolase [Clostridia bacterium]|nr:family 20 glycosylhydrolase [Clostridia bacterium]
MEHIWAYFIQLGHNMWREPCSLMEHRGPAICQATGRYFPEMITDRKVWRDVVDFLPSCGFNTLMIDVGEGMQYDSHPELSVPGAWSKDELRAEVKRIRSLGMEPVPKLNFSSFHDAWLQEYSRMKGTAKYYEVVRELIDEVCEVFAPVKYFHVGMDEEDVPNHKKAMTIIRSNDQWYHDLYFYMECVEKHGARPWVWGDYYRAHKDTFLQKMPKECLLSEACYERVPKRGTSMQTFYRGFQSMIELSHLGYDQIPTASTWACHQNMAQTVRFCHDEGLIDEHLLGFFAVPWQGTTEINRYILLDDAYRTKYAKQLFEEFLLKGLEKKS